MFISPSEKYMPIDSNLAQSLCASNQITEDDTESFPDTEEFKEETAQEDMMQNLLTSICLHEVPMLESNTPTIRHLQDDMEDMQVDDGIKKSKSALESS